MMIRLNAKNIESSNSKQSSKFHSKKPHKKEGKIYSGVRRVVVIVQYKNCNITAEQRSGKP